MQESTRRTGAPYLIFSGCPPPYLYQNREKLWTVGSSISQKSWIPKRSFLNHLQFGHISSYKQCHKLSYLSNHNRFTIKMIQRKPLTFKNAFTRKKSSKLPFTCIFTKRASLVTVAPLGVGVTSVAEMLGADVLCGIHHLILVVYWSYITNTMDSRFRIPGLKGLSYHNRYYTRKLWTNTLKKAVAVVLVDTKTKNNWYFILHIFQLLLPLLSWARCCLFVILFSVYHWFL